MSDREGTKVWNYQVAELDVVVHMCYHSTQEAEVGGYQASLPKLHSKTICLEKRKEIVSGRDREWLSGEG